MSIEKMFETAVRSKMRFPFRGQISVEDMWDLKVEELDTVYQHLNTKLKKNNEESLLDKKTKEDEEIHVKVEIVKYIVDVKLKEAEQKEKEKENKQRQQKILEALNSKKEEELHNKSSDELEQMLNDIES